MPMKSFLAKDSIHCFSGEEIDVSRVLLSAWYAANKREMPWRSYLNSFPDATPNQHAYAVWVSEIMLQQTQVATVVPYYVKWMQAWPSVAALSEASEERVREMWSGLGYYRRAVNLLSGAKIVMEKCNGQMPSSAAGLQAVIPGVGPYTAAAIASIVFGERIGVVDGNVLRVVSRLRAIGAEITSSQARGSIQELVNTLVDPTAPGDFNQALMELGALVCTPSSPACANCPLQSVCLAYKLKETRRDKQGKLCCESDVKQPLLSVNIPCVEECNLCLSRSADWEEGLGVLNFPRKEKKVITKEELFVVCVCEVKFRDASCPTKYCLVKRPSQGLLASFWEFPSLPVNDVAENDSDTLQKEVLNEFLSRSVLFRNCVPIYKGTVAHIFSHLTHNYSVYLIQTEVTEDFKIQDMFPGRDIKLVSFEEFNESAVSKGMKKVLQLALTSESSRGKKRTSNSDVEVKIKRQPNLDTFFSKVT